MRKLKWLIPCLALWAAPAFGQAGGQPCDLTASAVVTTLATVIPAPTSGSAKIRICGYAVSSAAASQITWSYGTGANCGTTNVAFGGLLQLGATSTVIDSSPFFRGFVVPPSNITLTNQQLCATATSNASITIYYSLGN